MNSEGANIVPQKLRNSADCKIREGNRKTLMVVILKRTTQRNLRKSNLSKIDLMKNRKCLNMKGVRMLVLANHESEQIGLRTNRIFQIIVIIYKPKKVVRSN